MFFVLFCFVYFLLFLIHLCSKIASQLLFCCGGFTLTNIFSGSQKIHFPCVCFYKRNGNCALQSASRITDEKAAKSTKLLSCLSVLSLCIFDKIFLFFLA